MQEVKDNSDEHSEKQSAEDAERVPEPHEAARTAFIDWLKEQGSANAELCIRCLDNLEKYSVASLKLHLYSQPARVDLRPFEKARSYVQQSPISNSDKQVYSEAINLYLRFLGLTPELKSLRAPVISAQPSAAHTLPSKKASPSVSVKNDKSADDSGSGERSAQNAKKAASRSYKNVLTEEDYIYRLQHKPWLDLCRRLEDEFKKRDFIGDVLVSEPEYELLCKKLREYCRRNCYDNKRNNNILLPIWACVALVQIAIREYEGNYYDKLGEIVDYEGGRNGTDLLTKWFLNTVSRYNKAVMRYSVGMDAKVMNIRLHGFVCNSYANDFFDFLFDLYEKLLKRDARALDDETMKIVLEYFADNGRKNANVRKPAVYATEASPETVKNKIRAYIEIMDRSFFNEPLGTIEDDRLTILLRDYMGAKESRFAIAKSKKKSDCKREHFYASPYIRYHHETNSFTIELPSQRFCNDFEPVNMHWCVEIAGLSPEIIPLTPRVVVNSDKIMMGKIADEERLPLEKAYLFANIPIKLMNNGRALKSYSIEAADIRFFDKDNALIKDLNRMPFGEVVSFAPLGSMPVKSLAIDSMQNIGSLTRVYDTFCQGDILCLPNRRGIAVGKELKDGLARHGFVEGCRARLNDGEFCSVYGHLPTLFVRLPEDKLQGTALIINGGAPIRLLSDDALDNSNRLILAELLEDSDRIGAEINLGTFLDRAEDGIYHVRIDVPADRSDRSWTFALINGFSYQHNQKGDLFKQDRSLTAKQSSSACWSPADDNSSDSCTYADGSHLLSWHSSPDEDYHYWRYKDMEIGFPNPTLRYRFGDDGQWRSGEASVERIRCDRFNPMLYIKAPQSEAEVFAEDDSHNKLCSPLPFAKRKSDEIISCDLTAFKSYFGAANGSCSISVKVPQGSKLELLSIMTRGVVNSFTVKYRSSEDTNEQGLRVVLSAEGPWPIFANLYIDGQLITEKMMPADNKAKFIPFLSHPSKIMNCEAEFLEQYADDYFGERLRPIGRLSKKVWFPINLDGRDLRITDVRDEKGHDLLLNLEGIYLTDVTALENCGTYKCTLNYYDSNLGSFVQAAAEIATNSNALTFQTIELYTIDGYGDKCFCMYDAVLQTIVPDEGFTDSQRYTYIDDSFAIKVLAVRHQEVLKRIQNL